MNSLPSLTTWTFAAAGLILASGPILIHLLSRRRYRTVHWSAMSLLQQSVKRSRRSVNIRDLILLALRTLAVLLFGLALAQPYQSADASSIGLIVLPALLAAILFAVAAVTMRRDALARRRWIAAATIAAILGLVALSYRSNSERSAASDHDAPVHLLLLLDNSMSMGYQSLDGTLLDAAKRTAQRIIERLPEGSRVSLKPLAGSTLEISLDPLSKSEASSTLDRIETVDRSIDVRAALDEAANLGASTLQLTPRIVLVTDNQQSNWLDLTDRVKTDQLPEVHIVIVSNQARQNTWITGLQIEDELADVETPTTMIVSLQHAGASPRENLQVTLWVADVAVASQTVTVHPGDGEREVRFSYTFDSVGGESGQATFVPVKASITPDRLPNDDQHYLAAPVVSSLPVVFVDQHGAQPNDVTKGRMGETKSLQHLLAPVVNRDDPTQQLVRIRHLRVDQLSREQLRDARLVVLAGVADPQNTLPLLREFVEQGGQLLIAAGGDFDPRLWERADQQPGAMLLPGNLKPDLIGQLPELATSSLRPVRLAYEGMLAHGYFRVAGISNEDLRDLYARPLFFRFVDIDISDPVADQLARDELQRQSTSERSTGSARWVSWSRSIELNEGPSTTTVESLGEPETDVLTLKYRPQVLARFDTQSARPFLVQRQVGLGKVLFAASGLRSSWNTLHTTDAILLFDRILRSMIQATLPTRNFVAGQRINLPLSMTDREVSVALRTPDSDEVPQPVDIGYIGPNVRGYRIPQSLHSGFYRVTEMTNEYGVDRSDHTALETLLSVNSPGEESDLSSLSPDKQLENPQMHWHAADEPLKLTGGQSRGQDWYWIVIVGLVMTCLLGELAILAWPALRGRFAGSAVA